jgi:EmrB/QacA subfamily drug resistance transporter
MPTAELDRRRVLVVISGLMLVMLLASLDQTIVSTALPTIVKELGGLEHLSWVVTAYLLAVTAVTPLYGKLGDLYGRKIVLQAALLLFLAGSALCGLAQGMTELIAFRFIQGLGGGGLMVSAQAAVGDVVAPADRGRYTGLFGAVFGVSSVAGPLLGGFMTTHISWRSIFYVNLPLGVLALIVLAATLPSVTERRSHVVDYVGTLLLALGLSSIILLTTLGGNTYDWGSPAIVGMGVFGVACLVALTFVERRAAEPILPPALFGNRVFVVTSAVGFVIGFALFGALTFLPLFQQTVRGLSPTASGLQLLPVMGGLLITSIVSGQVIARTGHYKLFPILGTAVAGLGMYLLSSLDETTSTGVAAFHMLILGLGLGMVMQVLVLVVQNSVPYDMLGVATSGSTLFRSIGGSLGTAILGAIFSGRLAAEVAGGDTQVHAFTDSLHVVFLVATGVIVIAFLLSWLIPEAPLRKTVDATVVGDTIGGPVDTDSLRELTRCLSRAAGRERTLAFLRGVVERAGVELSPSASWALLRLGAPERPTVAELAALPHVRADHLAAAMGQLRDGGLVAGDRVTPAGAELRERLVAARTEGLRELVSDWEPDKYPELDGLVRRLADELVPVPA